MATSITGGRLASINSSVANIKSAAPADDALFSSRVEERLCMPLEPFQRAEERLGLKRQGSAWTQTAYFDTDELAMPIGYAVRSRLYLKGPEEINLDAKEYFIDYGYTNFNRRAKRRTKGSLPEVLGELDGRFPLRLTGFQPKAAVQYRRETLVGHNVRVSVDTDIEGYGIDKEMKPSRMPMNGLAQIEVKHLPGDADASKLVAMLREAGATYGISKHYMVFNKQRQLAGQALSRFKSEAPDLEYEMKFDARDETPYTRFVIAAIRGELPGFRSFRAHPEPRREESFNEYRRVPGTDRKARLMYIGEMLPRVVEKNRGEKIDESILKRTELKNKMPHDELERLLETSPVLGVTRRVKYHFCVESMRTNKVYITSIDLNQTPDGRQLYQIELEYYRSYSLGSRDFEQDIKDELNTLAGFFGGVEGVSRTQLRKEDWAMGEKSTFE